MEYQTLQISYTNNNRILSFDLKDILPECTDYENRRWVAWRVDCDVCEWYQRDASSQGRHPIFSKAKNDQIELSFKDLKNYAENVGQTLDGFFLAMKPEIKNIPVINKNIDLRAISDLIIIAFDSSFFEVTTSDKAVLEKLRSKFKETEFIKYQLSVLAIPQ